MGLGEHKGWASANSAMSNGESAVAQAGTPTADRTGSYGVLLPSSSIS